MTKYVSLIAAILFLGACRQNKYTLPAYESRSYGHRIIAVVPPRAEYTGNMPKGMTAEQVKSIEMAESQVFQKEIYNEIIRESGQGKKDIRINVQSLDKTNQMLRDAGISITQSWDMAPDSLARLLGVHAVVKGNLKLNRFMSDFASYGINLAEDIIGLIRGKIDIPLQLPTEGISNVSRTYDVISSIQIIEAKDGMVMWGMDKRGQSEWDYQPELVVKQMARRYAKNFPYRDSYYADK